MSVPGGHQVVHQRVDGSTETGEDPGHQEKIKGCFSQCVIVCTVNGCVFVCTVSVHVIVRTSCQRIIDHGQTDDVGQPAQDEGQEDHS